MSAPVRPAPRLDPPHRLAPSPVRDRRWRRLTTLLGGAVVLLVVLGLLALSAAHWMSLRRFEEIPATLSLGSPQSLSLEVAAGDVRVLPSEEVEEVTLSLAEPGTTVPVGAEERVRAEMRRTGDASHPVVTVSQPQDVTLVPGAGRLRDVLVLVPADHVLDLELTSGAGDLTAEGDFTALRARTDVGDVHLGPVTAAEGVDVRTDVGAVDVELLSPAPAEVVLASQVGDLALRLPSDARGRVDAVTELGDVEVVLAGTAPWTVEAGSELGEVQVDPDVEGAAPEAVGTLALRTSAGDVTVTR